MAPTQQPRRTYHTDPPIHVRELAPIQRRSASPPPPHPKGNMTHHMGVAGTSSAM